MASTNPQPEFFKHSIDWSTIPHAVMTADMETLPDGPLQMLMRLRRVVDDGQTTVIDGGRARIAAFFNQEQKHIKEHLDYLEKRGYVRLQWDGEDQVAITVVALAELEQCPPTPLPKTKRGRPRR